MDRGVNKFLRRASFVSLNLAVLTGCGDVDRAQPVQPQELFKKDVVQIDRTGGEAWKDYVDAMNLHRAWAPAADSPWRSYYKPTLIAAATIVQSAARPIHGDNQTQAEREAEQFRPHLDLTRGCVIVDLPGEESVAWAAVLTEAGLGLPVPTFHNWPHQNGIVPLHRALGALIYYAPGVEKARAEDVRRRPVFMLELLRLMDKSAELSPAVFDNRYFYVFDDFPSAPVLKAQEIDRLYYVTRRQNEEDDLNEYFVHLHSNGVQIVKVTTSMGPSADPAANIQVYTPTRRTTIFNPTDTHGYTSTYGRGYRGYRDYHSFWNRSRPSFGGGSGFTG